MHKTILTMLIWLIVIIFLSSKSCNALTVQV